MTQTDTAREREIDSDYFAWEKIPVGKDPRRNHHRVVPVTVVTEVISRVIT